MRSFVPARITTLHGKLPCKSSRFSSSFDVVAPPKQVLLSENVHKNMCYGFWTATEDKSMYQYLTPTFGHETSSTFGHPDEDAVPNKQTATEEYKLKKNNIEWIISMSKIFKKLKI